MHDNYFIILKQRNFFLIWCGQVISKFGDRLTRMALIGLAYKIQPHSPLELAKMLSLALIPGFFISPIAGVYVDRWNKRRTLYFSDTIRGVFILLIPLVLIKFNSLLIVYSLIFLSFCVGKFYTPAKMALVPSIVEKNYLLPANSLLSITAMIAVVLGFGFGGVIVEKFGTNTAFIIDSATFFTSALLIFFMRLPGKISLTSDNNPIDRGKSVFLEAKRFFLGDLKNGIRYLFSNQKICYSVKLKIFIFAALGSLYPVFIVFTQKALSSVTKDLGWIAVSTGAGLFLGSLIYGRVGAKFEVKKTFNISLLLSGVVLLFFAVIVENYPYKILAFLLSIFFGVICSPIEIALNTLIHAESQNNFLGRVFSFLEFFPYIAFFIFMFTCSYLAKIISPFIIIVSISIVIIIFSLLNYFLEKDWPNQ